MSGSAPSASQPTSVVRVLRVARAWRFPEEVFVKVACFSDCDVGDLVKLVCSEYPHWGTANRVALYAVPGGRARALEVEANPASAADILVPAHKLAVDEIVPDKAWLLALVPPPVAGVGPDDPPPPAAAVTAALPVVGSAPVASSQSGLAAVAAVAASAPSAAPGVDAEVYDNAAASASRSRHDERPERPQHAGLAAVLSALALPHGEDYADASAHTDDGAADEGGDGAAAEGGDGAAVEGGDGAALDLDAVYGSLFSDTTMLDMIVEAGMDVKAVSSWLTGGPEIGDVTEEQQAVLEGLVLHLAEKARRGDSLVFDGDDAPSGGAEGEADDDALDDDGAGVSRGSAVGAGDGTRVSARVRFRDDADDGGGPRRDGGVSGGSSRVVARGGSRDARSGDGGAGSGASRAGASSPAGGARDGGAGGARGAPPLGAAALVVVATGGSLAPASAARARSQDVSDSKRASNNAKAAAAVAVAASAIPPVASALAAASAKAADAAHASTSASSSVAKGKVVDVKYSDTDGADKGATAPGVDAEESRKGGKRDAGSSSAKANEAELKAKEVALRRAKELERAAEVRRAYEAKQLLIAERERERAYEAKQLLIAEREREAKEEKQDKARERLRTCASSYCRLPGRFEAGDNPYNACPKNCGVAFFCSPDCRTRGAKEHAAACAKGVLVAAARDIAAERIAALTSKLLSSFAASSILGLFSSTPLAAAAGALDAAAAQESRDVLAATFTDHDVRGGGGGSAGGGAGDGAGGAGGRGNGGRRGPRGGGGRRA